MAELLGTIRLPERREEEVVLLRLPDGRVVARTRRELEEAGLLASSATTEQRKQE
jgi:hypothetical protein